MKIKKKRNGHTTFFNPYVIECPQCGNLILTDVTFGSGCCSCEKCSPKEFMRFDSVSKEALQKNQEKYADFLNEQLVEVEL